MKEQEELSKKQFPIEEVDNFDISFELDKDPVDYMQPMPLTFTEPPQKSSTTASSSSDNDQKVFISPKATFTD